MIGGFDTSHDDYVYCDWEQKSLWLLYLFFMIGLIQWWETCVFLEVFLVFGILYMVMMKNMEISVVIRFIRDVFMSWLDLLDLLVIGFIEDVLRYDRIYCIYSWLDLLKMYLVNNWII